MDAPTDPIYSPMKTKTWPELWPMQRQIAAEAAYSHAAESLRQAEVALRRIDEDPSARCVAIQAEIEEISKDYWQKEGNEEGPWGRVRNTTQAERDLIDSRREELEQALSQAEREHECARPARLAALEEEIARRMDALAEARHEKDNIKIRCEMARDYDAPGPIYSFETLREAIWAICPVRIERNQLGETYAQVEGVTMRITHDALLAGLPPSSLGWVLNSQPGNAAFPPAAAKIFARAVYIEASDQVLVREDFGRYAYLFGSLDGALCPHVDELRALESIDISDEKPLPLLGEIIRDACRKLAVDTAGNPKFFPGQRRLRARQIDELIGVYWQAFIDAPWEASIVGSYALLKHRCARGETPNVFACETQGHFGFRVRTPDHDWIMGEIFCPPEYFSPAQFPEQEVVNRPMGQDWVAELGPVKFLIQGKTSRS